MKREELENTIVANLSNDLLSDGDRKELLDEFEFWNIEDNILGTNFEMSDFKEALRLVNLVGEIAEAEGHHPDITIYEYKNVAVSFTSHEAGGITLKDFAMAAKIEKQFNAKTENIT